MNQIYPQFHKIDSFTVIDSGYRESRKGGQYVLTFWLTVDDDISGERHSITDVLWNNHDIEKEIMRKINVFLNDLRDQDCQNNVSHSPSR